MPGGAEAQPPERGDIQELFFDGHCATQWGQNYNWVAPAR